MTSGPIYFGNQRYKVPDLKSAKKFYSEAFQLKTYFDEPTWVVFEIEGQQLWLEPIDLDTESVYESTVSHFSTGSSNFVHFAVEDVEGMCSRYIKLGGSIEKQPTPDGPFTQAIVKDPWGNRLGLYSRKGHLW